MEVRTVLVVLLSRFHFELDPGMGDASDVSLLWAVLVVILL